MNGNLETELREFIVNQFLFGQGGNQIKDDDSLLRKGLIDSTGVLEIVAFLEQRFAIAISDLELVPDNLDSIERIARFVRRKRELEGTVMLQQQR